LATLVDSVLAGITTDLIGSSLTCEVDDDDRAFGTTINSGIYCYISRERNID
jgi:hypothetical protein